MTSVETPFNQPPDILARISAANQDQDPEFLPRKYAVMRQTPFSFMRGTCHLFFATLAPLHLPAFPPAAWLCGDLHVENFGAYKGDNRLTYFDVTDFDETAMGDVTLDLVRFLTSIRIGAVEWGVSTEESEAAAQRALVAYSTELAAGKASWVERENARGALKRLFAQVAGRSRNELLDRYTTRKGKRRRFVIDEKNVVAATDDDREAVAEMMRLIGIDAHDQEYFRLIDVARRVAGTGSIGRPRFIALIEGRGSPDRNVLLDVKSATPSSLVSAGVASEPVWPSEAERIIAVQRHSAAVAPAFLHAVESRGRSFTVRELQPAVDRVRLKDWEKQPRKLADAMTTMASVAAWMHLRGCAWRGSATVDEMSEFARDSSWRDPLMRAVGDASARAEQQFREFGEAYDAGYFARKP